MRRKHQPQRSCVVCRTKRGKRELTRLVIADGRLRIDETGKMNGRGAYLCGDDNCWMNDSLTGQLSRALRFELSADDRESLRQMKPS